MAHSETQAKTIQDYPRLQEPQKFFTHLSRTEPSFWQTIKDLHDLIISGK